MSGPAASPSATSVIVLGAGMVGVCSAVHLARAGHEVTLVDRRLPGCETSHGNLGVIQREAVSPYAFPRSWRKIAAVALGLGVDVAYHARALPRLASPLFKYWRASSPAGRAQATKAYSRLIARCLDEHATLIREAACEDLIHRSGFMSLFRSRGALDLALKEAQRLRQHFDVSFNALEPGAVERLEPMLQTQSLSGAIHWLDPWTVSDPSALVQRYAGVLTGYAAEFVPGDALTLAPTRNGWRVQTSQGLRTAAHAVVCLGPWSRELALRLGYDIPLFVKRGYHQHYHAPSMPSMPVLDAENGFGIAPMRAGLRLTTGAEFAARDAASTPTQLARALRRARDLIEIGESVDASTWVGSRPCMPDMLPVVGPAFQHRGLWFNFGHGHQGFTLGPVTGRMIAQWIGGDAALQADADPYSPQRFAHRGAGVDAV